MRPPDPPRCAFAPALNITRSLPLVESMCFALLTDEDGYWICDQSPSWKGTFGSLGIPVLACDDHACLLDRLEAVPVASRN